MEFYYNGNRFGTSGWRRLDVMDGARHNWMNRSGTEGTPLSLLEALLRCFRDEPGRVFGIQDLCGTVRKYYTFSAFQEELDPIHPQPRYAHAVRSTIARMKKSGEIARLGRNQYQLSN